MAEIKCPKCGEIIKLDKSSYDALLSDIEKEELERRIAEKESYIKNNYETKLELEKTKIKNEQEKTITDLKNDIKLLNQKLESSQEKTDLAVTKARQEEIQKLSDKQAELDSLKQKYDFDTKALQEQVEQYKNFRLGDSTKDLGESLEQYCHDAFDEIRAVAYPRAYFEKDNDVDEEGKGDFIFRDYAEDGTEIVSIMFEMKNQKDTTATKKKNEHFFDKLNKNRNSKNCEFAVLVSTLEEDSKLYNSGIVDVSHRFPKMYVVRPQNFLSIIGLLKNMAINNLKYKQQIVAYQKENIDITHFEDAVRAVADKINTDYDNAGKQYDKVEKMCDDMIKKLQDLKETFRLGQGWLGKAQNQLPNLEIRKLTHNNPTMKERFEAIDNKDSDK